MSVAEMPGDFPGLAAEDIQACKRGVLYSHPPKFARLCFENCSRNGFVDLLTAREKEIFEFKKSRNPFAPVLEC